MRPLDKGSCPQENGVDVVVTSYANWRNYLIQRIGYYCVYCNIPLSHSLNVEHVVPKVPRPGEAEGDGLSWDNMLLACGPCNNTKSNQPIILQNVYFPETNNTLLAFDIEELSENIEAAIVKPKNSLIENQRIRAAHTIELLGLDVIDNRPNIIDIRWKKRRRAMLAAEAAYKLFNKIKEVSPNDLEIAAEYVAINASEIGFFTLWFKIFVDEQLVIKKLIDPEILPGTAQDCFLHDTFQAIHRNPGNETDPI